MGNTNNNRSIVPIGLIAIGVLLIAGAAIWYIYAIAPQTATIPETAVAPQVPPAEISRVSLADAKAAYDNGSAVFLDVRDADSYASSHVPGALLIPLDELQERSKELDPSAWIITYCT